jgi:hypothetical protein
LAFLAFLHGLTTPFDTHQAERDWRMLTVEQNISGAFGSAGGAGASAGSRGDVSRLRK